MDPKYQWCFYTVCLEYFIDIKINSDDFFIKYMHKIKVTVTFSDTLDRWLRNQTMLKQVGCLVEINYWQYISNIQSIRVPCSRPTQFSQHCLCYHCSYHLNSSLPLSLPGGCNNITGESINKFLDPNMSHIHSTCYYHRSVTSSFDCIKLCCKS